MTSSDQLTLLLSSVAVTVDQVGQPGNAVGAVVVQTLDHLVHPRGARLLKKTDEECEEMQPASEADAYASCAIIE